MSEIHIFCSPGFFMTEIRKFNSNYDLKES